ncbi:MAG: circularly permuted type 2 ATP-grasp protein [Steroidobacteraceae bacterium]
MTSDWLKTYHGARRGAKRYDELRDPAGQVHAQWQTLLAHISQGGVAAAQQGIELARDLIAENGVTYNVYADAKGTDRPWVLDTLPLVLTAAEWSGIERGVQQRAQLLNAVLADIYGPQRMLADGIVPPELVYGHPSYLWPCRGIKPVDDVWLPIYAVDLARAPDGGWWALSDRTQAPSGAGYALENRQITARIFPTVLRDLSVRNVRGFFTGLREQLLRNEDDDSLAVVLTSGVFNETYFEHAYLARQLGLLLVQGHDLTVRNDTVYLKTLAGLRRVHAILRRMDDDYCDPVELRADSALGVPGLLQAVRAGRVMLANPLGSGVLDSAAWMGFLPGVSEWLLGEKLQLPSVATWWCGEKPALDFVFKNFDHLVIKSVFPNQRRELVFGKELKGEQRQELFERMRRRPHTFVAQERFALSQVPAWRTAGPLRLAARAVSLRVYAVATPQGYRVLPGGLARIAGDTSADVVTMQQGGGSKDVWVLSDSTHVPGAIGSTNMEAEEKRVPLRSAHRHAEVPSSLGENQFWLGRYHERCENKIRLLRATLAVRVEPELWQSALNSCRQFGLVEDDRELQEVMFDAAHPTSLNAEYKRLYWCATQVRGRLSTEHWRTISVLRRQMHDATQSKVELRETLDWLLLSVAAMSGFALDDMNHDDGWHLMSLGRRLERLEFLCELLAGQLQSGLQLPGELDWLLEVCNCTISYRTRYVAAPRLSLVMDLLLRDVGNPRTLMYQREMIRIHKLQLAESLGSPMELRLTQPMTAVLDIDTGVLEGAGQGASYARQLLAARLLDLTGAVRQVSDDLSLRYFSHVESAAQMVSV